jgi:hypothetical protein
LKAGKKTTGTGFFECLGGLYGKGVRHLLLTLTIEVKVRLIKFSCPNP